MVDINHYKAVQRTVTVDRLPMVYTLYTSAHKYAHKCVYNLWTLALDTLHTPQRVKRSNFD